MSNPAEGFFGGLLLQVFIACMLYGVTTLQTFIYFQRYPADAAFVKTIVAIVWVVETIHTAFCMRFSFAYLIDNFGNVEYFLHLNWGVGISVIAEVIVSTVVQIFYVRRVWIISEHRKFLTGVIALFTLLRLVFGAGSAYLCYRYPEWIPFRNQPVSLITVTGGLGCAAAADLLVALTLSYYLLRGRTNWDTAERSKIRMIVLYVVNTGAITGAASVLAVVLFSTQTANLVFLGIVEIQGKLYANSFLGRYASLLASCLTSRLKNRALWYSLNAREHIRESQPPSRRLVDESFGNIRLRSLPSSPSTVAEWG
ncbi:uncharacterized protein BXZ73DRAFT_100290 [Epithele typhae]|uniref:uncharacterized protein n=1 Tax=Epithele typhae TaxID=378194 RepID=UPI002008E536|nr:uncharacterized protein BXZ73DRAFT_100290 [Epithele typhae]KAH9936875.1 hypothetical protein BXZ73DRAFT_100290 [Epithele typhae]